MQPADYIEVNRKLWNEKTSHHVSSEFYDMAAFKAGKSSLNDIELALLGDINGKSLLHLQCHFGQDTLSLAKMGAKVTGVDLSDKAIQTASDLSAEIGVEGRFIVSDIYALPQNLKEQFDIVFTSYGTIGWLPDMKSWAEVVAHYLKPGGKFIFAEFHPAMWMFDNDFTHIQYSYFNKEIIIETEKGTYADKNAAIELQSVNWNHDLGEVIQALINAGLSIELFSEYDYSPYHLPGMVKVAEGKYMIEKMEHKLPLVYSIRAVKV